ncbi:hypothetical protein [Romboutsia ilealis]|uniref:hypothetical protein n=1 Tax=Romboutsia ilealis TaxID=1115758 RepID=UPI002729601E|nr:hypothetical protein [Romboutsia ilealis]
MSKKNNKEKETKRKDFSQQRKILTELKNGGFLEYDKSSDRFKYIPEKFKTLKEI